MPQKPKAIEIVAYRVWIVTVVVQQCATPLFAEAIQQLSSGKLYCHT